VVRRRRRCVTRRLRLILPSSIIDKDATLQTAIEKPVEARMNRACHRNILNSYRCADEAGLGYILALQRFAKRLIRMNVATEGFRRSMPSHSLCKPL
jgi:hypothetical protein